MFVFAGGVAGRFTDPAERELLKDPCRSTEDIYETGYMLHTMLQGYSAAVRASGGSFNTAGDPSSEIDELTHENQVLQERIRELETKLSEATSKQTGIEAGVTGEDVAAGDAVNDTEQTAANDNGRWKEKNLALLARQNEETDDSNLGLMLEEAEVIYRLVSAVGGETDLMEKTELIKANGGDFKLFEALDEDESGTVTLEEWLAYLKKTRALKGAKKPEKGDRWLQNLLYTLRSHISTSNPEVISEVNQMYERDHTKCP